MVRLSYFQITVRYLYKAAAHPTVLSSPERGGRSHPGPGKSNVSSSTLRPFNRVARRRLEWPGSPIFCPLVPIDEASSKRLRSGKSPIQEEGCRARCPRLYYHDDSCREAHSKYRLAEANGTVTVRSDSFPATLIKSTSVR